MKPFLKKIGWGALNLISPLTLYFIRRNSEYFTRLRAELRDLYYSSMVVHFNWLHESIFKPYFEKVGFNREDLETIRKYSKKGTLVYVMKNRGQLEYSFFNHLFLKEGIPLARFANGCRTLFWRPFREIWEHLMWRLDYYYRKGLLEDPIQSGYLENIVTKGESVLLNLKISRELIFGTSEEALAFIAPLLRAAQKSKKPVYLVTQQFLYDRHPERTEKSWIDFLFGEKSNPGMFRKLIMFLMFYRKQASVKMGAPLDLQEFIQNHAGEDPDLLAKNLNALLLERLHIEKKSIRGPILQSREKFFEKILRNANFKERLGQIQVAQKKSAIEIQREVSRIFYEIAASVNYTYVDLYDRMIEWMNKHIFEGLEIDTAGLNRIKNIAGKHSVILVPAHKSHIDYLLLSYIFYNNDLTLPHICAGINLKFWPVEKFIRRAGGFFIRRSFEGNLVYKLVLEHYLKLLVQEGYSIEFFIEGTRSRAGKLLKPKMGILSMLLKGFLDGVTTDLYFVPVSINYERILEEKSYINEMRGSEKSKENVTDIFKVGKSFRKKYGKVFIQFADPISAKEFWEEQGLDKNDPQKIKKDIEEFAYRLTYQINRVSVVTSTAMVSTSLLSQPAKSLSQKEILARISILEDYLKYKGAQLSSVVVKQGKKAYLEALEKLTNDRLILKNTDFEDLFYSVPENLRPALDYHRNSSIHFFVSLVTFSKILFLRTEPELSMTELCNEYNQIKKLLSYDFTFSERASLREHLGKVIAFYEKKGFLKWDAENDKVVLGDIRQNSTFQFYASLLDAFFESSYLTLLFIKHTSFKKHEQKKLLLSMIEKGKALHQRGTLRCTESLSQFNLKNALLVYADMGLVKKEGRDSLSQIPDRALIARWEKILRSILRIQAPLNDISEEAIIFQENLPALGPSQIH